jgi:hypothetical protein
MYASAVTRVGVLFAQADGGDLVNKESATAVGLSLVGLALLGIVAFAAFQLWGVFEIGKLAKKLAGMALILVMTMVALAPAAAQSDTGKRLVCSVAKVSLCQ